MSQNSAAGAGSAQGSPESKTSASAGNGWPKPEQPQPLGCGHAGNWPQQHKLGTGGCSTRRERVAAASWPPLASSPQASFRPQAKTTGWRPGVSSTASNHWVQRRVPCLARRCFGTQRSRARQSSCWQRADTSGPAVLFLSPGGNGAGCGHEALAPRPGARRRTLAHTAPARPDAGLCLRPVIFAATGRRLRVRHVEQGGPRAAGAPAARGLAAAEHESAVVFLARRGHSGSCRPSLMHTTSHHIRAHIPRPGRRLGAPAS